MNVTGWLNTTQGWGIVSMRWSEQTIFSASITAEQITLLPVHSDGLGSASWIKVSGITGCEGNTPWRNQRDDMLTYDADSCTFTTGGTEVQWPTGNPLWTGIPVDPFVISYQPAVAVPEPSVVLMLTMGLFMILSKVFRYDRH